MDITDYTSYDEVRSAVGLSSDELPDSELALEMYQNSLSLALRGVNLPTSTDPGSGPLSTRFLVIAALATRTDLQQYLYDLTRMFSAYSVALEVATALSMKTPKAVSDSKVSLTRFSPEATFRDTVAAITLKVGDIKSKLESIVLQEYPALTFMGVATPSYDRVTNE